MRTDVFSLFPLFQKHMKGHNVPTEMEPPFDCDYCGFELPDYEALCEHRKLHLNRPDFECVLCHYKNTKKNEFKNSYATTCKYKSWF